MGVGGHHPHSFNQAVIGVWGRVSSKPPPRQHGVGVACHRLVHKSCCPRATNRNVHPKEVPIRASGDIHLEATTDMRCTILPAHQNIVRTSCRATGPTLPPLTHATDEQPSARRCLCRASNWCSAGPSYCTRGSNGSQHAVHRNLGGQGDATSGQTPAASYHTEAQCASHKYFFVTDLLRVLCDHIWHRWCWHLGLHIAVVGARYADDSVVHTTLNAPLFSHGFQVIIGSPFGSHDSVHCAHGRLDGRLEAP